MPLDLSSRYKEGFDFVALLPDENMDIRDISVR